MSEKRMRELVDELNYHNKRYYTDNNPEISDEQYDRLYRELVILEKERPDLIQPDSPTGKVGAAVDGSGTVKHSIPMLSLENSYNREDVAKFVKRVYDSGIDATISFTVEPKMDGAAVGVTYGKGRLMLAATRGDGVTGEIITRNVLKIQSLPSGIDYEKELVVRGEIFMPRDEFSRLNSERSDAGLPLFANPRNAAAGSLKLLDSDEAAKRGLDIYLYGVDSITGNSSHWQDLEYCKSLGLPVNSLNRVCSDADEIEEALDYIENLRFSLPYEIDGAVIKVNEYIVREELGSTGKFPRWAIAYKYPAMQATTVVKGVVFQVGRTGAVTPVAELEPVLLSGSTISRATLHNEDEIIRLGVMIGDVVFIEKGGEIIPKIVKVVEDRRPADAEAIIFPADCPECGTPLVKPEGEARWRCFNLGCKARVKAMIGQFVSRDAMDIEGFGDTLINALVDESRLKRFADIYTLTKDELAARERMGERSAQKLIDSIEKSKKQPFSRVLFAVGLTQVGVRTSSILAKSFKSMARLMKVTKDEFLNVEDIGEKTADILIQELSEPRFAKAVDDLEKIGLSMEDTSQDEIAQTVITGKSFLITGTLSQPRKQFEDIITAMGGKLSGTVSKNLDYLIVGEKAGSKLAKAEKLGIAILTESDFGELIKE